jgi:hypothetical protein
VLQILDQFDYWRLVVSIFSPAKIFYFGRKRPKNLLTKIKAKGV